MSQEVSDPRLVHKKTSYEEATVCHTVIYSMIHIQWDKKIEREKKADVIQLGGRWSWTDADGDLQHPESDI